MRKQKMSWKHGERIAMEQGKKNEDDWVIVQTVGASIVYRAV